MPEEGKPIGKMGFVLVSPYILIVWSLDIDSIISVNLLVRISFIGILFLSALKST